MTKILSVRKKPFFKYNFFGEIRTYEKKLNLIGEGVVYMGFTNTWIDHWNPKTLSADEAIVKLKGQFVPKDYTVDDFLADTKQYDYTDFPIKKPKVKEQKQAEVKEKSIIYAYSIDNITKYFDMEQNIFELRKNHKSVKYLGIKFGIPVARKRTKFENTVSRDRSCCYCEVRLTADTFTRDHITPKSKGGKIIKPCCKECNFEKGSMLLREYIGFLNGRLFKVKGGELTKLQTKIKNANNIAIEINKE